MVESSDINSLSDLSYQSMRSAGHNPTKTRLKEQNISAQLDVVVDGKSEGIFVHPDRTQRKIRVWKLTQFGAKNRSKLLIFANKPDESWLREDKALKSPDAFSNELASITHFLAHWGQDGSQWTKSTQAIEDVHVSLQDNASMGESSEDHRPASAKAVNPINKDQPAEWEVVETIIKQRRTSGGLPVELIKHFDAAVLEFRNCKRPEDVSFDLFREWLSRLDPKNKRPWGTQHHASVLYIMYVGAETKRFMALYFDKLEDQVKRDVGDKLVEYLQPIVGHYGMCVWVQSHMKDVPHVDKEYFSGICTETRADVSAECINSLIQFSRLVKSPSPSCEYCVTLLTDGKHDDILDMFISKGAETSSPVATQDDITALISEHILSDVRFQEIMLNNKQRFESQCVTTWASLIGEILDGEEQRTHRNKSVAAYLIKLKRIIHESVSDDCPLAILALQDNPKPPDNFQLAVALYILAVIKKKKTSSGLVKLQTGAGKSRIIAALAGLFAEGFEDASIHIVFPNKILETRDKANYKHYFGWLPPGTKLFYYSSLAELGEMGPNSLVLIDEIDYFLFSPTELVKLSELKSKAFMFGFSGSLSTNECVETAVLLKLGLKEFDFTSALEAPDAKVIVKLPFGVDQVDAIKAHIQTALESRPVLVYCTEEQANHIPTKGIKIQIGDDTEDVDHDQLEGLDKTRTNCVFPLVLMVGSVAIRGIDYRGHLKGLTLYVLTGFSSEREQLQCLNRVGRFNDKCSRFCPADLELVDLTKKASTTRDLIKYAAKDKPASERLRPRCAKSVNKENKYKGHQTVLSFQDDPRTKPQ